MVEIDAAIVSQIVSYETMVSNMKWHLQTNGWSLDENQKSELEKRIVDHLGFINTLRALRNA